MITIVHIAFLVLMPALIQFLSARYQPFKFMGATIVCFLTGMIYSTVLTELRAPDLSGLTTQLRDPLVPLGIAVMLFSTDITRWLKVSPRVVGAYFLGAVSVMIMAIVCFVVFRNTVDQPAYFSSMLTASYVGGTPNMSAVKLVFNISDSLFGQAFLSDVVCSSIYLVIVMVFAKRVLFFLKPYKFAGVHQEVEEEHRKFRSLSFVQRLRNVSIGFGCAILVMAVSLCSGVLIYGSMKSIDIAFLILLVTAISVAASFYKPLRNMPGNFETGDYLFCIFFLALGSMTNFGELVNINGNYLLFTMLILFGSFALHALFCKLCGIDRDTMVITSAAGIMSPPFIPSIASAIHNKELMVPGIAVGIIGLAAANFAAILIGKLLLAWPF